MAINGIRAYANGEVLPNLVERAVDGARSCAFTNACLPSQGRLLQLLAGGIEDGTIGETGTGVGVGLAWLASGAGLNVRLVSVEIDRDLAERAAAVFSDTPAVQIRAGDWRELRSKGPFAMLVLDGGGQGKSDEAPIEPSEWMVPGGLIVIDDFTPCSTWPPLHQGRRDDARLYWLQHPALSATEVRTQPDASTIIARYHG